MRNLPDEDEEVWLDLLTARQAYIEGKLDYVNFALILQAATEEEVEALTTIRTQSSENGNA